MDDKANELLDKLRLEIEILRARCVVSDEALNSIKELHGIIWSEAYYDSANDKTREFAKRLYPLVNLIRKELGTKRITK